VVLGVDRADGHHANKDAVVESSLRRAGLWNEVARRLRTPGEALSGGQQRPIRDTPGWELMWTPLVLQQKLNTSITEVLVAASPRQIRWVDHNAT
jgi:hypothetical protein